VNPGLQEPVLDRSQQMIGQHTKEDVGLHSVLQMMENGPLQQRAVSRLLCKRLSFFCF